MSDNHSPKTLMQAVLHFSDEDVCHEYVKRIKWPDGEAVCSGCGCANVGWITSRRLFQCREKACRKQFSVKVGTIFEDSALPLSKWLVAVWCIVNARNGISSYELHRTIGITQKSAWHMLHRIRLAMQTKTYRRIRGEVESDTTYVGGLSKNMHKSVRKRRIKGRGGHDKTAVHGLLERGGQLQARVVKAGRRRLLSEAGIVRKVVEPGALVYTDIGAEYQGLGKTHAHKTVNHAIEYVNGRVHTNNLECFWSILKRTIRGTYVSISPEHLGRYLDEYCRRYNIREKADAERFGEVMRTIVGRRLRYRELIG